MDIERARAFLLSLPDVVETQQWGANLVFWVGDKAIGGKMFAMVDVEGEHHGKPMAISFATGPERFHELLERDGFIPAPYMARIFWVAAARWGAARNAEWEELLHAAHALTADKLPARVKAALALPAAEREALIARQRTVLAAAAARAKANKAAARAGGSRRPKKA